MFAEDITLTSFAGGEAPWMPEFDAAETHRHRKVMRNKDCRELGPGELAKNMPQSTAEIDGECGASENACTTENLAADQGVKKLRRLMSNQTPEQIENLRNVCMEGVPPEFTLWLMSDETQEQIKNFRDVFMERIYRIFGFELDTPRLPATDIGRPMPVEAIFKEPMPEYKISEN